MHALPPDPPPAAIVITGRALETVGLPLPRLKPAEVLVLEFSS